VSDVGDQTDDDLDDVDYNRIDDVDESDDDDSDDDDDVDYNRIEGGGDGDGAVSDVAPTAIAVLEYLVRELVDDADAVEIEVDEAGRRPALNVHVGPGDLGRVIGKRGRVAKAIRRVTRAAAVKDGVEIDIEFVE
jgi:predicted RNA-binding protein YlqC (UPF0109 family)